MNKNLASVIITTRKPAGCKTGVKISERIIISFQKKL